jgi:SAM-dependent methyltransferase
MMSAGHYVFAKGDSIASQRLQLLAEIFDPVSHACFERIGVAPGWSCWEVGAGYGTIAQWLHERIAPDGYVLATDLDPRFLARLAQHNLRVLRHDIVDGPLPARSFDLIHARLLLCHLPSRERVLDRMIEALKPGGWLVIEDFDGLSLPPNPTLNPAERLLRSSAAVRELLRSAGAELNFGRRVAGLLRERGMSDVNAEGRVFLSDEERFVRFQRLTIEQVQDELLARKLVSPEELADDLATLDQRYMALLPTMWSVVARRQEPTSRS